ncbi:interleukin-6 receptor subunit alpha isoform X2 [Scleropages formosus]|uniref:Interleukin 6 receptor n=1 Tax=Scleropages formosus TaxID=113540 RepID=A0A8C9W5R2_SCLFO|nr:interleukin-6 receptor subunit alpha isoform X2 [Scleropages formosus]
MSFRAARLLLCALLGLVVARGSAEDLCPRREPGPNVKVLAPGSKVTLSCSGRVTVDGAEVALTAHGQAESDEGEHRGARNSVWSTSKEGYGVSSTVAVKTREGTSMATVTDDLNHSTHHLMSVKPTANMEDHTLSSEEGAETTANTSSVNQKIAETLGTARRMVRGLKQAVQWRRNGRPLRSNEHRRDLLELGPLNLSNSGNYSCYKEERLSFSIKIVVWGEDAHTDSAFFTLYSSDHLSNNQSRISVCDFVINVQLLLLMLLMIIIIAVVPLFTLPLPCLCLSLDPSLSLEKPSLSCYRKSPTSKIRCDWTASKPVVPVPQCHLILRKGVLGQYMKSPCMYSEFKDRCWCVLDPDERMTSYLAFLCVSNIVGNVTSPGFDLNPRDVVKPDPPYNVTVREDKARENRLIVSWRKPITWKADYYQLVYQLRYSVLMNGEIKGAQQIVTKKLEHTIMDALSHTPYVLQVRAKEEFDIGQWSEWSTHLYTPTRRGPESSATNNPMDSFDTAMYNVWCSEGSGMADTENVMSVSERPQLDSQLLLHVSWAVGACLLLTIIVLFAYIIRLKHRTRFMCKLPKLSRSSQSQAASPPSSPLPKEEGNPLVFPELSAPTQNTDNIFQEEEERGEGIHLNNMGYFLAIKE